MKFFLDKPLFSPDGAESGGGTADVSTQTTSTETSQTPTETNVAENTSSDTVSNTSTSDNQPDNTKVYTVSKQESFDNTEENGNGWVITVDPITNQREMHFVTDKSQADNSKEDSTAPTDYKVPDEATPQNTTGEVANLLMKQQGEELAKLAKPYTDSEFTLALQMDNVDETRVPQQYAQQYLAAKVKRQQILEGAKPENENATSNNQNDADPQAALNFYKQLDLTATAAAMKEIGITQEELDAAEYSDDTELLDKYNAYKNSLDFHKRNIEYNIREQAENVKRQAEQQRAQEAAMLNDISTKVAELKKSEPNFEKIDQYMNNRYKTLPFEQAAPIAEIYNILGQGKIINAKQSQVLLKYYEDSRKDFYAKNHNLSSTPKPISRPPIVENPGSTEQVKPNKPNYAALRNMDYQSKDAFIAKLFNR